MLVKICGLRDEEHIRAAVEAGADAVGFVFADSVRRIEPDRAAEITNMVPDTIKKVAVMLHPSNDEWQDVLRAFRPDVLQTDVEDFINLDVPVTVQCWPVYREGNTVSGTLFPAFVYEGAKSGTGQVVDWTRAADVGRQGNMILAGGLGVDNVAKAIATARPYGVDVSSGVESGPGQKDATLIRKFISAARAAERKL